MSRPRVLVLADVPRWAWDRKARAYERYLSDEFEVVVAYQTALPSVSMETYDLVHCFEVAQLGAIPLGYSGKRIAGLTALVWRTWGEERMRGWATRCDALHGNSPAIVEALRPFHTRVYYCPNGVDTEYWHRSRPRKDPEVVACHVGKPNPRKGGAIIIEACRRVGMRCLLVQRSSQLALPADAIREIYQDAWVQVVASTMDGTPNPALESAACENMLLSSPVGNMPEIIEDGMNGFLYRDPPLADAGLRTERLSDEAVEWYAERLAWCQMHAATVVEMGREARWRVVIEWTWADQVEHVRRMWRDVLMVPSSRRFGG